MMGCKWLPQVFGIKSDPGIIWCFSRKCMDSQCFSMVPSGSKNLTFAHENPNVRLPGRHSEIICFIRVPALYLTYDQFYLTCRHFYLTCGLSYLTCRGKARSTRNYNVFQPVSCGHRDSSGIAECPCGTPTVTSLATSRKL